MARKYPKIKFAADDRHNGDVVNPGGWFGKAWVIGYPLGNFAFYVVVEADTEQDAIDELADSKEFGHAINLEESDVADRPEDEITRAGNDGHPVDLDNVTIAPAARFKSLRYFGEGLPEKGLTPKEYDDFQNQT